MVIFLWRRGAWKTLLIATIVALVVVVALYAPFWQGPQTLQPIWNQTSRVVWSPASLLIVLTGAPTPVRILAGVVWLAICALVLVQRRDAADVAASSGWVLVATLLLLTSAVFSHYLVPAVALAAVAQDERFRKLVMWLSMGALAAYAVELLSLTFGPDWIGSDAYRVAGSLTLLAPSAALLPWRAVARRR
jgi:hypothetical protein